MAVLAGGTVDLDVLDRWLDEQGLPPGPLTEAAVWSPRSPPPAPPPGSRRLVSAW